MRHIPVGAQAGSLAFFRLVSVCKQQRSAAAMNLFRFVGDMLHLLSIFIFILKIYATKNCNGIYFFLFFLSLVLASC
jgi:hypothetical protein